MLSCNNKGINYDIIVVKCSEINNTLIISLWTLVTVKNMQKNNEMVAVLTLKFNQLRFIYNTVSITH